MKVELENVKPMEIEKRSFEIITEELGDKQLLPGTELIVKRCIHTSADFEYLDILKISDTAVENIVDALKNNNFRQFLTLVKESGNSSYKYLQNIYSGKDYKNQPVSVALAVSELVLKDNGVCRVHGGGFAGTIQAFVKNEYVSTYKEQMEKLLGENTCHVLKIRKYGGIKVL